jgi:hypothetical protein
VLSIHGLQHHLPVRALHFFGAGVGGLGCLTLIPSLASAGALFGILHIFWFVWVGALLYRANAQARIIA